MKQNSKGFSLIELLIVVAIILIIAAIAIPDLLKSRQAANQASAVGSLRTINTSEVAYSTTYTQGFSPSLFDMDGTVVPSTNVAAGLIDSVLASGIKSNYHFQYVVNPAAPGPDTCVAVPTAVTAATAPVAGTTYSSYEIGADPLGCASGNYYFTDMSGVIRLNTTTPASPGDSPLAG
ncbi:MAG TPA: prepilin-type N-terminal cleavage/methylation domain-containing protein [Terriglobia bacterium]|nr:prepilin-type N-terminal cleavage/methylation domain-containing protein [Terriglobia bacterium]